MIEQQSPHSFDDDLKQSLKSQRHPFVGQCLREMAKALNLTLVSYRNATPAEDVSGADIICHFAEMITPIHIDLKLMTTEKAKKVPLEWKQGSGQKAAPWAISNKSDLILWVNVHYRWALFAVKSKLRDALINKSQETTNLLSRAFEIESATRLASGELFSSKCSLVDRVEFQNWLINQNVGGGLLCLN